MSRFRLLPKPFWSSDDHVTKWTDHFRQGSPTNFRREHITLGTDVDGYVLASVCHLDGKAMGPDGPGE